ncbi:MAG: hypothetical protein HGB19_05485, partial [Chlorobiales bacterium]|nr:hypothetical protein [Chlorobiales bacterium]
MKKQLYLNALYLHLTSIMSGMKNNLKLLAAVVIILSAVLLPDFAFAQANSKKVNGQKYELFSPADTVVVKIPKEIIPVAAPSIANAANNAAKKGGPVIMAALSWDGGGDGTNWNDANNWNPNQLPTSSDDVTIPAAASVELISGTPGACKTLNIAGNLVVGVIGTNALSVADSVYIQSGGSCNNSGTVWVGGNWRNAGTLSSNSGSAVYLNKAGAQAITITGTNTFYNLYLRGSGTKTANSDLNITNQLYIERVAGVAPSFDPKSHTISVGGDFRNEGTLLLGTGTFNFNGAGWQSIYSNNGGYAPGKWNFNNIIVSSGAGGIGVYDTLSVNGNVTVDGNEYIYLQHYVLASTTSE